MICKNYNKTKLGIFLLFLIDRLFYLKITKINSGITKRIKLGVDEKKAYN